MGTTATGAKTKKWSDIKNETMSPESQARARKIADEMLAALPKAARH
jgi:hypothetical protein